MTLPKEERMRMIEKAYQELNKEFDRLLRYLAYVHDRLHARGIPFVSYETWKKGAA